MIYVILITLKPQKLLINAYIPAQVTPSPLKPVLQVQDLEPIVFVHLAFLSQLPFPSKHSFTSTERKECSHKHI